MKKLVIGHSKALADRMGVALQRKRNLLSADNVLRQVLADLAPDLVVDVGANRGQYGRALRSLGYAGPIVSFEPLHDARASLSEQSQGDACWTVAPPMALGDRTGEVTLNIAANSVSSSVLLMAPNHSRAAPQSIYVGTSQVPVARLDEVLPSLNPRSRRGLLKIDTQGYEQRVLTGAAEVLPWFAAVQLELSLLPLYKGQPSSADLIGQLAVAGYELAYIIPGFQHPTSGRLLQFDGIFVQRQSHAWSEASLGATAK